MASGKRVKPTIFLAAIGPGLLVAATGVGAGDLATAGIAASRFGYAVLWAIVLGAAVKFVLTEGLARWQLATGTTLIEGVRARLGRWPLVLFLLYLVAWCFFVSAALVAACGVASRSLIESFLPARELGIESGRLTALLGAAHALVGLAIAWLGGFKVFERVMGACIALMFLTTIAAAIAVRPDLTAVAKGLTIPTIPEGGFGWTIALMGGVGGTVTVLAYGYWLREAGRDRPEHLRSMRIDLAVGYGATALFGIAVGILAAGAEVSGSGANFVVALAQRLDGQVGPALRAAFLVGVWAAMFSSLLGVWQAAPSIVADTLDQIAPPRDPPKDPAAALRRWRYRTPLLLIALVPLARPEAPFAAIQKLYAVTGAAFIPLLTLVVLVLTTRRAWIGEAFASRTLTRALLFAALVTSCGVALHSVAR